ncbi:MAG: AtpZ/AtpI family protein [Robiginitomaculum sp.]|nr:AtpZ/AtpI family protein [Robiginitomaculum sp.]
MTENDELKTASPELEKLGQRLQADREKEQAKMDASQIAVTALGGGFRIAIEMLAALGVGMGLGFAADAALGTTPWIMVIGIFVGFATGFRNAIRSAEKMNARYFGTEDK